MLGNCGSVGVERQNARIDGGTKYRTTKSVFLLTTITITSSALHAGHQSISPIYGQA